MTTSALTDEQIANWRRVLFIQIGPAALVMSKELIQQYKDKLQKEIDDHTTQT